MADKPTITNLATGEEISPEEKAKTRALLRKSGTLVLAPGVEEEMKRLGLDLEEVRRMMLEGLGETDA